MEPRRSTAFQALRAQKGEQLERSEARADIASVRALWLARCRGHRPVSGTSTSGGRGVPRFALVAAMRRSCLIGRWRAWWD